MYAFRYYFQNSAQCCILTHNLICLEVLAKDIREFRSPTDGETRMFYEIVVAPKYTQKGLEVLRGKYMTLRILEAGQNTAKGNSLLDKLVGDVKLKILMIQLQNQKIYNTKQPLRRYLKKVSFMMQNLLREACEE